MKRLPRIALSIAAAAALAAVAAWMLRDPHYLPTAELDRTPYPMRRIDIDPAASSGNAEYYGRLRFDLFIGRGGKVDRVEIVESTLPPDIAGRVVKSFREARWQPGLKAGRDVPSVKRVEVEFEPPPGVGRPAMRPEG